MDGWRDRRLSRGAFVEIKGTVKPTSIRFSGDGATLAGSGRILLSNSVSGNVGTTNSITALVVGDASFEKLGAGTLAVSFAKGAVEVKEGALLLAGSRCANLRVSAASGATVELLGEASSAGNLLGNGSFEDTPITAANGYPYMNGTVCGAGEIDKEGTALAPWKVSDLVVNANNTGIKTWCGAANIVGTGIPDGNQLCILQRFGSIMQEVSVADAGWYDLAFIYYKRGNGFWDHRINITVDDVAVATLLSNMIQPYWVYFSSGLIWLPAGTHTVRLTGDGWMRDVATFVDDVRLSPVQAGGVCRNLTGPGAALTAVSGASIVNSFAGSVSVATLDVAAATVTGTGTLAQNANVKVANAVSGNWSSAALWADGSALVAGGSTTATLAFPSLAGLAWNNDLAGAYLFNSLWFGGVASGETATLSGNEISSRRDGSYHDYLYQDTPGTVTIESPVTVNSNLLVETEGNLTFAGTLNPVLSEGAAIEKIGGGTLTIIGAVTNFEHMYVMDGTVEMKTVPANTLHYRLRAPTNSSVALYFNIEEDRVSSARYVDVFGEGLSVVGIRTGVGRTMQFTGALNCYSPLVQVDVGEGDTLEYDKIVQATYRLPYSCTSILKTGPGVFQVRNAGSMPSTTNAYTEGVIGSIFGGITVREGFVRFGADDFSYNETGLANIYTGTKFPVNRDGSLGHDTSIPLMLGDPLTPVDAVVGVGSYISTPCSTRTYIATPYPAEVIIHAVTNGVYHLGTVVLQRSDLTLGGPDGDVADVDVLLTNVELDGVPSATITRSGNVRTILNAATYPAGLTLVSDRMLEVGFRHSLAVSIGALSLSGSWQLSFDTSGCDNITAGNLTLGATAVSLWDDVNGCAFAESGTYTILRYTTLTGDVSSLSVADESKIAGYSYAFADDGNGTITLTITSGDDNPVYTWINTTGGTWGDAANWDHTMAPNANTAIANFGNAAQANATVTLAADPTINAISFYNSHSYTLTGSTILFDGIDPYIFASAGDHEIASAVENRTATPLSVQSTAEGSVRFSGDVTSDLAVERGSVTFAQGVDITGDVTVTGATLTVESNVDISGTATLGQNAKLVANDGASIARFVNTDKSAEIVANGTLTVGGDTATYGGKISGAGPLVKTGSSTVTLNGDSIAYTGDTYVNAGSLALGVAMLPSVTHIASGASLKASGVNSGMTGDYYGFYNQNSQNEYMMYVFSRDKFNDLLKLLTYRGKTYMPLATNFAIGDSRENPFPSAYAGANNYWVAAYTANLIVPETGFYKFYTQCDDAVIFQIDGFKVFSSESCKNSYGGCYLTKGIHYLYLGLFEISGNAYVSLFVMQPSETAYKALPGSWIIPDTGASEIAGAGSLAPDADTVVSVAQATGFNCGFSGSIDGQPGGMVQKTGDGTIIARYASGDVAAKGGTLSLYGNTAFDTVRTSDDSTVHIVGGTIQNLFGDGHVAFGSYVYTIPRINGDADSGFSTNKTYTHLVNFPLGSQAPTINGVTVNNTGSWSWGGTAPGTAWGSDGGSTATGLARLVYRFIYGSADFSVNLSGLTSGKLYDLRLYFRNYATNNRQVMFVFSRSGKEIGRVNWNPDRDENGTGRPYTSVGCRYLADSSGAVTVRVISLISGDKCHFYGFSNELIGDAPATAETVSLTPANGVTMRQTGGISGNASLSLDGVGTQIFGGTNSLPTPLAVNDGRAVLGNGTVVTAGVVVANGAVVELQGNATVNGISGVGSLCLGLGDSDSWGALQSDGTFAAPQWPRRVNITGDADCGVAPFKKYTHFVNLGSAGTTIQLVNEVPIACSDGIEAATLYYDLHHGGTFSGVPTSVHRGGNPGNIVMDNSNAIYNLLYPFQYLAGTVQLKLERLTAGKTYEFRLYIRNWASQNRTIDLYYDDGTGMTTTPFTFNEDTAPEGYIAIRYTPTGSTFTLKGSKRDQGFHVYAFSNEEVCENVRTLHVDSDQRFSGAVSGNGELRKTGTGTWIFSGTGVATGAWKIEAGAIALNNASSTTGPIAVCNGATFGGIGSAGGAVGVASGAALWLGTPADTGTLAIGGDLAVASGAIIQTHFAPGANSTVTVAGAATLPSTLLVQVLPTVLGTKFSGKCALVTATGTLTGPADFTGWSAVDEFGNTIPGARFNYSDDGHSVFLNRPCGTILFLR